MIELLKEKFPVHYNLHNFRVSIPYERTHDKSFDLEDVDSHFIVCDGMGKVSYLNQNQHQVTVINFELFLNQCKGKIFERHKRCDFIVYSKSGDNNNNCFVLNELTSAKGTLDNLTAPIKDKKTGKVVYKGGKLEKGIQQLLDTLLVLNEVPEIGVFVSSFPKKIALLSYIIYSGDSAHIPDSARLAFSTRYLKVESREAKGHVAELVNQDLNKLGFKYYRLCHPYKFILN